jgi:hypothetical protein
MLRGWAYFHSGQNGLREKRLRREEIAGHWQITPVVLVTWEAEMRRIKFETSLGK